jgi:ketosteroid isomerase-like protein
MSEESTTPDLVELARHTIACANRGDVEAMVSFFAPDAEWRMTPLSAPSGEPTGRPSWWVTASVTPLSVGCLLH